jgi:hypothetical protein
VSWTTEILGPIDIEIAHVTGKVTGQSVELAISDKQLLSQNSMEDVAA